MICLRMPQMSKALSAVAVGIVEAMSELGLEKLFWALHARWSSGFESRYTKSCLPAERRASERDHQEVAVAVGNSFL